MRPVSFQIAGRSLDLRLTIDDLDKIAAVNPQFGELNAALATSNLWDWREVCVIVNCALAPHKMSVADIYEGENIAAALRLARDLFSAALPQAEPGKPRETGESSSSTPTS